MADPKYPKAPDLQEWVTYYGGYQNIPWRQWDEALANFNRLRRDRVLDDMAVSMRNRIRAQQT
jgi:hypothetical protein